MKEGWDYSLWNNGGRNVFYFLDSNHINVNIQQKLVDEGQKLLGREPFSVFFLEGFSGNYNVNLKLPVGMWKEYWTNKEGYFSAGVLLSHYIKIKNMNSCLFGVEDNNLMKNQAKTVRDFYQTYKNFKDKDLDIGHFEYLKKLRNRIHKVSKMRSDFAVKSIDSFMDLNDIDKSILMYGAGHFEDIVNGLLEKDIGLAFYFPGRGRSFSLEEDMDYGLSF